MTPRTARCVLNSSARYIAEWVGNMSHVTLRETRIFAVVSGKDPTVGRLTY